MRYPKIELEKCIQFAEMLFPLWQSDGQYLSHEAAVKALGYKEGSLQGARILAELKKYGMIGGPRGSWKPLPLTFKYFSSPAGSRHRHDVVVKFAQYPLGFSELDKLVKNHHTSEEAIADWIVSTHGMKRGPAVRAAQIYLKNLAFLSSIVVTDDRAPSRNFEKGGTVSVSVGDSVTVNLPLAAFHDPEFVEVMRRFAEKYGG